MTRTLIQQPIRLRVTTIAHGRKRVASVAIPVMLTGVYDLEATRDGVRVRRVEIWLPCLEGDDDQLAWVEPGDLENADGQPLSYVELRRGLLTHWLIMKKARQSIERMAGRR